MSARLIVGDCRVVLQDAAPFDLLIADPPYGETSLAWDRRVEGWLGVAAGLVRPTGSLWVFGSLKLFMATAAEFERAGWRLAQDIVWEKHNGSSIRRDRIRRVHEIVAQFWRADQPWSGVWNETPRTMDAVARTVRRKMKPPHMSRIGDSRFVSEDGGPRLARSVQRFASCHGRAIHPTEKPTGLLELIVRTSCPPGGIVGDMFAGSGAAGEACHFAGRRYVGAESDPEMAAKAAARLAGFLPLGGVEAKVA